MSNILNETLYIIVQINIPILIIIDAKFPIFFNKDSNNKAMMSYHDEERRSHSLDGDLILGAGLMQHLEKSKNKSAWSKVKGIVKTRSSRKSVKSTGSNPSRDVSPIENDVSFKELFRNLHTK